MKMRKLIMAALLSAVMVLLLMPASAFADSELLPEKIVYRGDTVYQPGILDSGGDKREPEFTSFYEPGSEIDITWSNGKTVTYVYKEFTYRQDGETLTGREHFPKEEAPHVVSDGDGSGNTYPDNYLGTDCSFGYNVSDSGLITVWCEKSYWSEEQDDEVEKRVDWKAQGKTPVGLSFDGKMLYEKTEDGIYVDTYPAGGKIIVKYSDGSTRKAVCKKWGTNKTENGETYPEYGYFFEGEKPVVSKDEEGYNFAENELSLEFDQEKASAKKGIPVTYMGITSKLPVTKKVYPKPTAAKFVPAKGFVVKAVIGQQSFDINDIGKKGNKFVVSMSDGTKRTYTYKNKNDGFVWKDSDGSSDSIYGYVELNKPVTKGTKNAAGKINV